MLGKYVFFYESQWILINYNTKTMSLGREIIRGNVHKVWNTNVTKENLMPQEPTL